MQRNSKLVILGDLGMSGDTLLKWYNQFEETFDFYLLAKNQLLLYVFLEILQRYWKLILGTLSMPSYVQPKWHIAKTLKTCYFGYFEYAWLRTAKVILSPCGKLVLSTSKKSASFLTFFWRYLGTLGMPAYVNPKL